MKKVSVSRLKKLPLLLGTLLIVSVAAYGTRAYFSDSATQQGDIQLSLGTVDISTDKTSEWQYTPLTTGDNLDENNVKNEKLGESMTDKGKIYTNVRPGDSFVRTYSIQNTGTLDVKVELSSANIPVALSGIGNNSVHPDGPFNITVNGLKDKFTLAPEQELTYTVTITVDPKVNNTFNAAQQLNQNTITKNYLEQAITIKAVQMNAKDVAKVNN